LSYATVPDAEKCTIVSSFFWTKYWNVTLTDGRTHGPNCSGYYSGLHCEQCECAVKTT